MHRTRPPRASPAGYRDTLLAKVPATAWTPALDHKDQPRKDADLVEITDMLDLTGWPDGMRVIVRREPIHPK